MIEDSPIIAFYRGRGTDAAGRSLADVMHFSMVQLEDVHDYIQWLFPLPEPSEFNRRAPVLAAADIAGFNEDVELRRRLRYALELMLEFYGFDLVGTGETSEVRFTSGFDLRKTVWLSIGNHNYLRITRILRSCTLLGCGIEARAFLMCLEKVWQGHRDAVGARAREFWHTAAAAPPTVVNSAPATCPPYMEERRSTA